MVQNLAVTGGTTLSANKSDLTSDYTLPVSSTSWTSDKTTKQMFNGWHLDAQAPTAYDYVPESGRNTGSYYSYIIATAGTESGTTDGMQLESGEMPNSICPKGWKLPTGGSEDKTATPPKGQFQTLVSSYTTDDLRAAFNAGTSQYTARCDAISCPYSHSRSSWWSRTVRTTDSGYTMRMDGSGFDFQNYSSKYYGRSVRCVLTVPQS